MRVIHSVDGDSPLVDTGMDEQLDGGADVTSNKASTVKKTEGTSTG